MMAWPLQLLIAIIVTLLTVLCGAIGVFLRGLRQDVDHRLTDLAMHVESLRHDVTELRVTMPREYVLREDWVLATARVESKLDRLVQKTHAGQGGMAHE